jgi:hypothetical protein
VADGDDDAAPPAATPKPAVRKAAHPRPVQRKHPKYYLMGD